MEILECSKLWRWLEGMVPSGSKGWWRSGPMKSSMDMEAKEPAMIKISSRYLNLVVGNHGGEIKEVGLMAWSLMLLMRCQRPISRKPKPGATCPIRVPIMFDLFVECFVSSVWWWWVAWTIFGEKGRE